MDNIRLKSIRIERLFEIFDYHIEYPTNENVLIITGPNGFGKTQILNIIFNLFNKKFLFFQKLVFDKITVFLENEISIEINKEDREKGLFSIRLHTKEETFQRIKIFYQIKTNYNQSVELEKPTRKKPIGTGQTLVFGEQTDFSLNELVEYYDERIPDSIQYTVTLISETLTKILDSVDVHLIKEQRLFKKVNNSSNGNYHLADQTVMIEAINSYAEELKKLISNASQKSYSISQKLDSSYPNRLISEKRIISKEDYDKRFESIQIKQEKLNKNGLYESQLKVLEYSKADAKALLVYLNDLEEKLSTFDKLLEKLELFTGILNERRFTFKSINIDRDKGFYFQTSTGKSLELNDLSSGEQHEVVLLYELIFNTKPNILVLIDEPEISLHVTWQKEFLKDLLKIIEIQQFQVLVATHSPSIINDRWDLVYNLEKNG